MMTRTTSLLLAFALLPVALGAAAIERPHEAPALIDYDNRPPPKWSRVDPACNGREPHDSCHIPGRTFAGGGEGTCTATDREDMGQWIDLLCVKNSPVVIDHGLQAGTFRAPADFCAQDHPHPWACVPTKLVADASCRTLWDTAACEADLTVDGVRKVRLGVCRHETEKQRVDAHGWITVLREVLVCLPPGLNVHRPSSAPHRQPHGLLP